MMVVENKEEEVMVVAMAVEEEEERRRSGKVVVVVVVVVVRAYLYLALSCLTSKSCSPVIGRQIRTNDGYTRHHQRLRDEMVRQDCWGMVFCWKPRLGVEAIYRYYNNNNFYPHHENRSHCGFPLVVFLVPHLPHHHTCHKTSPLLALPLVVAVGNRYDSLIVVVVVVEG